MYMNYEMREEIKNVIRIMKEDLDSFLFSQVFRKGNDTTYSFEPYEDHTTYDVFNRKNRIIKRVELFTNTRYFSDSYYVVFNRYFNYGDEFVYKIEYDKNNNLIKVTDADGEVIEETSIED